MAHDLYPLPPPDLTRLLGHHIANTYSPDVAFDLALNQLVVRAADATGASTAALALLRGDAMVCRASTGPHAPGLGVPISTNGGLAGECVRTRAPQLCNDAESDPRVDSNNSQPSELRSVLVVPVFDEKAEETLAPGSQPELAGVLEVFSSAPNAFSEASQSVLEEFAREASHVQRAADERRDQAAEGASPPPESELLRSFDSSESEHQDTVPQYQQPYEVQTLVLGALVIFAAIGVSFMVGSRVGWLRTPQPYFVAPPAAAVSEPSLPTAAPQETAAAPPSVATVRTKTPKARVKAPEVRSDTTTTAESGDLVVYDNKGKVIFRIKSPAAPAAASALPAGAPAKRPAREETAQAAHEDSAKVGSPIVPASSSARIPSQSLVWLAPEEAEKRLLSHVDPQYPADALAAHRSGSVVLEVNVAADGTVSSAHTVIGDPLLGAAAAKAVRTWRYQPYRANDQPAPFQTDVSLTFSLPN